MPLPHRAHPAASRPTERFRGRRAALGTLVAGAVVLGAAGYATAATAAAPPVPSGANAPVVTTAAGAASVVPLPAPGTTTPTTVPLPAAAGSATTAATADADTPNVAEEATDPTDELVAGLDAVAAQQAAAANTQQAASLGEIAAGAVQSGRDATNALRSVGLLTGQQADALTCVLDVVDTQVQNVLAGTYRSGAAAAGLRGCLSDLDASDEVFRSPLLALIDALSYLDPTPSTPPATTPPVTTPPVTTPPTNNPGASVVAPARGTFTSGFGSRGGTMHYGIDIANSIGTPIVAVTSGTVINAGPASGFGLWVRIRHDDGTITTYGHNDTNLVVVGQRVVTGQQIATIGNRGDSTGPHVHFEVTLPDGTRVDPRPWLAARGVVV